MWFCKTVRHHIRVDATETEIAVVLGIERGRGKREVIFVCDNFTNTVWLGYYDELWFFLSDTKIANKARQVIEEFRVYLKRKEAMDRLIDAELARGKVK